jgi:hypothetical protein
MPPNPKPSEGDNKSGPAVTILLKTLAGGGANDNGAGGGCVESICGAGVAR